MMILKVLEGSIQKNTVIIKCRKFWRMWKIIRVFRPEWYRHLNKF